MSHPAEPLVLVPRLAEAAIRRFAVDHFLEALEVYPRAAESIPKLRGIDLFSQPVGHLIPIAEDEWKRSEVGGGGQTSYFDFYVDLRVCGSGLCHSRA